MPTVQYRPSSPGRRFQTASDFAEITRDRPEKSLTKPKPSSGGRNAYGRMTSRHSLIADDHPVEHARE